MTLTITYAWWWIPAFITVLGIAFLWLTDDIFSALAGLLVIATSWAVAGALK